MALITTTAQLRTYIPINVSFVFSEIQPFIEPVEQEFIVPIIGQAQLTTLTGIGTPTGTNLALIQKLRKAISFLSVLKWIPFGNLVINSGGFGVTGTSNQQIASQWRVDNLEETCRREGYNALEQILEYLWSVDTGTFTDWDASDEKLNHRSTLFLTSKDFTKYYNIDNSYDFFCTIKPGINEVQQQYLKPILGDDFFDQIMDQIADDSVSANNAVILTMAKRAAAPLAIYESVASLGIKLDRWGITTLETSDQDTTVVRKPAQKERLSYALNKAGADGKKHLGNLRAYLNNNASDTVYPLYYASDLYSNPEDLDNEDDGDMINEEDSGVFIM